MRLPSETSGHIAIGDWLDRRGYYWWHTPNGGKRSKRQGNLLKRMGTRKGMPDFLIATPPPCGGYVGAAMELKRDDGGDGGSEEQKENLAKLKSFGWAVALVAGEREGIAWLMGLGY